MNGDDCGACEVHPHESAGELNHVGEMVCLLCLRELRRDALKRRMEELGDAGWEVTVTFEGRADGWLAFIQHAPLGAGTSVGWAGQDDDDPLKAIEAALTAATIEIE